MRLTCCLWLIGLAGCAGPGVLSSGGPSSEELLALAEPNQPVRLVLQGNHVLAVATPLDYRYLPALVRTTCDTIAPTGELVFCARERGPRGDGYRVEKRYQKPVEHLRSVLVDADGRVLERAHTVPLAQVAQHVLATALAHGTFVESAEIVSGPVAEEFWRIAVKDRQGRLFVITIDLDGQLLTSRRRNQSRVDS